MALHPDTLIVKAEISSVPLMIMLLFNVIGEANDEVIIELILEGVSNGTS